MIGKTLGHYEITSQLGKGGMVEVYQADIFAFGVVLFEMLTGRLPFTGEAVSETLAAVLKQKNHFSQ